MLRLIPAQQLLGTLNSKMRKCVAHTRSQGYLGQAVHHPRLHIPKCKDTVLLFQIVSSPIRRYEPARMHFLRNGNSNYMPQLGLANSGIPFTLVDSPSFGLTSSFQMPDHIDTQLPNQVYSSSAWENQQQFVNLHRTQASEHTGSIFDASRRSVRFRQPQASNYSENGNSSSPPSSQDSATQKRWTCPEPTCLRQFKRKGDMERHHLLHGPPRYFCDFEGCTRVVGFHRWDKYQDHKKIHGSRRR